MFDPLRAAHTELAMAARHAEDARLAYLANPDSVHAAVYAAAANSEAALRSRYEDLALEAMATERPGSA